MTEPTTLIKKVSSTGIRVEIRIEGVWAIAYLDGERHAAQRMVVPLERPRTVAGGRTVTHYLGRVGLTADEARTITQALQAADTKERAESAQRAREELHRTNPAAFAQARETGQPQTLKTWMEDCNDPTADCSLDHCTLLAMPDGSTRVERGHTH